MDSTDSRSSSYPQEEFVDSAASSLRSQMWLLLHGGGARPSWPLQRHPHHLPAQAGGTLLPGLFQHVGSQGVAAPVKLGGGLWDAAEAPASVRAEAGGGRSGTKAVPRRSSTTGQELCKQELRWRDGSPEPLELGQDQRVRTRSCFNLSFFLQQRFNRGQSDLNPDAGDFLQNDSSRDSLILRSTKGSQRMNDVTSCCLVYLTGISHTHTGCTCVCLSP